MADGSWALQQAIYGVLNGLDPALASGGVHAGAPQDHPKPYVQIGESTAVAADVQCRDGLEETLSIHVWTKAGSQKQVKEIMSRVREALHAQNLTVTGRASALSMVRSSRVFPDQDGQTLHGVVTVRVIHHQEI